MICRLRKNCANPAGGKNLDVSALSYVQLMYLIYTDATGENAASAFYSYSMAANAYKAAH